MSTFIGNFKEMLSEYAKEEGYDGVIYTPAMNSIGYYNCGDWVENCSALVENKDGTFELLTF